MLANLDARVCDFPAKRRSGARSSADFKLRWTQQLVNSRLSPTRINTFAWKTRLPILISNVCVRDPRPRSGGREDRVHHIFSSKMPDTCTRNYICSIMRLPPRSKSKLSSHIAHSQSCKGSSEGSQPKRCPIPEIRDRKSHLTTLVFSQ